jgi:hypothetical protein
VSCLIPSFACPLIFGGSFGSAASLSFGRSLAITNAQI